MSFVVVGTPGDRRPALFAQACRSCGLPEPRLIAWTDVLRGAEIVLGPGDVLRIDSPGEDPAADALLRGPGDPSRVGGGARWYSTFVAALGRIQDAAVRAGARLLGDVEDIAVMFDKRRSNARLASGGVPVPRALPPVRSYAELRANMDELGERRVFIKPAHGSSASGVVALQAAPGGRVRAVTSTAMSATGLFNSLRVRAYETERDVAALIDALAPDGLHVERWLPKASIGGRVFDLRVVVIGGTPTHVVARTSRSPMTNLHLGGVRGDMTAVRRAIGPERWRQAMAVCARAAACFPRSPMVGVDLLVLQGMRRFAVCEVNAFGDLLPGLTGLAGGPAEGLDTYTAQVRAALPEIVPACTT
jgi:glutathione synthase/RimK-type ligase-like ATP-grasp enzyme